MAKVISQFFRTLGYPFRNDRWSWGARRGDSILLRTWNHEYSFKEKKLGLLANQDVPRMSESFGLDERIVHLKAMWEGQIAGYTVIATVKDENASPREIAAYRDDAVFALDGLESLPDGTIVAHVGAKVPVAELSKHAMTHRTAPGVGPFPVGDDQRSGLSTDSYKEKIPAIKEWLIDVCGVRGTVTYAEVMTRFGLTFYPLRNAMSQLGHKCQDLGEPIITALIVDKDTHKCSQGLYDEFGVHDDDLERERCYAHWPLITVTADEQTPAPESSPESDRVDEDFHQRMARFTRAQSRPEQGAFREAVFRAFDGRCAVSGCAVPEALEAAHLLGRDWRQGHNAASDGILLRRDLHSLYDRGLMAICAAGQVTLDEKVMGYYAELHGRCASARA